MRNAGIRVWVLTGDKVETAKTIGYSCKLLTYDRMDLLEFPSKVESMVETVRSLRTKQLQLKKQEMKVGMVVPGDILQKIIKGSDEGLYEEFVQIALESDVVLCCRVSPKQKQEVVALVKKSKPEVVTLSIGDGANDVSMITEAHVGIGIRGVEGMQAARASDFSIGEFKSLKRLLFFHGRESYRKNSTLILYNFFKNVLLCMPQFWFGWSNWLSGQTLYEAVNYQLFNITFTSAPIIIYALFDKQTTDIILQKDPLFYAPGPLRLLFNTRRFLLWFAWASLEGLMVVLLSYWFYDMKFSNQPGNSYGFWVVGHMTFLGVVYLANLKICTFSSSFSVLQVILLSGSYVLGLIVWAWVSCFATGVLEFTFFE